jgi:hypothetical protein
VIIEPRTRRVVEVIHRGEPRATGSVSSSTQLRLTPEKRRIIHRMALQSGPRASTNITLRRGAVLPQDIEIVDMPQTIVTEVPEVRSYDYVVVSDRVILVEPQSRRVVDVIE